MSTTTMEPNYELRKRRGSFPQLNNETLSAEMLAPLPQGNISKTFSSDELLETEPLLQVLEIEKVTYSVLTQIVEFYN